MTATTPAPPRSAGTFSQALALTKRSLIATTRRPGSWLPGFFFPFMIAAVYSSQFSKATDLPGFPFPDASFLEFILPASILQGVAMASVTGSSELALDIENGFMDRLVSSPVARPAIIIGRMGGAVGFAAVQVVVLGLVFIAMGADIAGGVGTIAAVILTACLLALGLGSIGSAIALKTGSQEVVQSLFPLIFVTLFVSSAFFPVGLMEGWYGAMARNNPITWLVDRVRRLVIVGFDTTDAVESVGIAAIVAVVGVALAFRQLQRRLEAR